MKAFPPALTFASNKPFLSIENFKSCVSSSESGYELYETWLKNSASIAQDSTHGQELVNDASTKDIKTFCEMVIFIVNLMNYKRIFLDRLQLLTSTLKTTFAHWKIFMSGFVPLHLKLGFMVPAGHC